MTSADSSISKGSDQIHDYSYSKCEEDDVNTEAQHFCPKCEHYLCDKCASVHGVYLKKHTVYGRGDIQKWAGFSMDKCDQHGNKLKFHCDDHQKLCCSDCVTLNHRLCRSISNIPDLARGFSKTEEFKRLPAAVNKVGSVLDELKNARMKDQASLKDSYKNIIAEIKALRKEINKILDQFEKKSVQELDRLIKDLEKRVKDDLDTCAHMNDQLKTMVDKLQQITGKAEETDSYIGFRKCQTKLNEVTSMVQEIQRRPREGVMFKYDESVLPFLRNILGTVENVHSISKTTDNIHVFKAQIESHHSVKIKNDEKDGFILGICELPSREVVIADFNNRVKLLDQQFNVIDCVDLPAVPFDLCSIPGNEVAVASQAYDSVANAGDTLHEIHILSVTKGQLHAVRKFNTDHMCRSVIHHKSHLYVGSYDALYMYTIDGRLEKKMYEDKSGGRTVYKSAASPDGERFYVTNNRQHKLVTMDKNGQVLSKFEDPELKQPAGICVSPCGYVFVCGSVSNTVLQVDREGTQKLATVVRGTDDVCKPVSVWFNHASNLIVGKSKSDDILVIKLC
ncbi:uncharacterized protein LOC128222942 [Mya arenaria]|uniref:uncharacterized protein LOC128222942 n=1 Tax=Mya arenaria TaxID=6604 RepID=UPI0022E76CED|nr:uncharacterized protein LOC128222942 [Mya arenaria]